MNPGVPFLFLISGQPDRSSPNCPRDLRAKPKAGEEAALISLILITPRSYQLLTRQMKQKRQVENRRHQLENFPALCLSVCLSLLQLLFTSFERSPSHLRENSHHAAAPPAGGGWRGKHFGLASVRPDHLLAEERNK